MTTDQVLAGTPLALSRGRRGIQRYGWRGLSQEVLTRAVRPALAPVAARRLQRLADQAGTVSQIMDLIFDFDAYGITIAPYQSHWEFRRLLEEVEQRRPQTMVEIGTAKGGSLLAFCRLCAPDAHIVSIDLPGGPFGGGYPLWKKPLYKAFAAAGQRLDLVRGDSHSAETLAEVQGLVAGRPVDFLFIDGDHGYDGVRSDFERYRALVRPGGLIAFHDIVPLQADSSPRNNPGDVPRFWAELMTEWSGEAIVDPEGHGCFGIGLIRV
jgi:predicted O-methyltransferase YrrM